MYKILVQHKLGSITVKGEGSPKFLLTSNGSYFYNNPNSKYRGLYFIIDKEEKNWNMFKVLDFIEIKSNIIQTTNNFDSVEILTDDGTLTFYFHNNVLSLKVDYTGELIFRLDMREIYDFDDKGRVYTINKEDKNIVIEYKKYWNNVLENIEYSKYLVLNTEFDYEIIDKWKLEKYEEDRLRHSGPTELYVYDSIKLKCTGAGEILMAFGSDKEGALSKIVNKSSAKKYESQELILNDTNDELQIAYNCAIKSMQDLIVNYKNQEGIFAGLPWFFQFWTRDEAISLHAFTLIKKYDVVKSIIYERIFNLNESGRIFNRYPHSTLETADGTGWMFKRLYDLILYIKKNEPVEEYFNNRDFMKIRDTLKKSINIHRKNAIDKLIKNKGLETWMDTSYENDNREGFRIEIQCLWLSMLSFSNFLDKELGHHSEYYNLEFEIKEKVKNSFFKGGFLHDGIDDPTVRPNIFLAYYLYPQLLEKDEWEQVFDNSIPKLWLEWGGLSSIEIDSKLFCPNYSGENNKSYHRGDSWFFINNLAALSMSKLNKEKYTKYINLIIKASSNDILFNGIIARPSELSSAIVQKAQGNLFQLWSAATFIELLKNNYEHGK